MQVIDGKHVAKLRRLELKGKITEFSYKNGRPPGLAVILVGNNPASQVYVGAKIKACQEVGINSFEHRLAADISQNELNVEIEKLNHQSDVDGILLQLPLPAHLSSEISLEKLDPNKDVDALTVTSQGLLFSGHPRAKPCTPQGVISLLRHYKIPLVGINAVVVGRSNIVGKPMAHLLLQENATVTICHSKTKNLRAFTKNADLVVVALGKPGFLGGEDFKSDAVVIDVGIHRMEQGTRVKLLGDVRFDELSVKAATPVPGGVGPMTIVTLLENTLELALLRLK